MKCQHVQTNKSSISSPDVGTVADEEVELPPEDSKVCFMLEVLSFFFSKFCFRPARSGFPPGPSLAGNGAVDVLVTR